MNSTYSVNNLNGRTLFDADVSSNGNWVAVVGLKDIADTAIYLGNEIRLHRRFRYPIVRIVGHNLFLIVDARAAKSDPNASLVSLDSPWKPKTFHAGDGIKDVIVTTNHIVFTYFDEGVFGDSPISQEGLSVFDHAGTYRFGYLSRLGSAAVDVADCYAACHVNGDEIAFCPYTAFPLVNWDLRTGAHSTVRLPSELHGLAAMTAHRGEYFFHSSYKSRTAIFHYKAGEHRQIGTYDSRLKTLRDGQFLHLDTDAFPW